MQKALPNSLQIFNKKRTRTGDRHFSKTYTQGRETRFLTDYLVAKPLTFLRNPVFWRGIGSLACRMPNPLFPSAFYPLYPLHAGVTSARWHPPAPNQRLWCRLPKNHFLGFLVAKNARFRHLPRLSCLSPR